MSKQPPPLSLSAASAEFNEAFPRVKEPAELRNPDGTFPVGHKEKRRRLKTHGLSASLQRFMLAKYGNARVYYEWLISIADPATGERTADRLKAIEAIAARVDGNPVTTVEMSGPKGEPVEVSSNVTPASLLTLDRLAAVAGVLHGTGALALAREAGGTGNGPHAALEQVPPANQ